MNLFKFNVPFVQSLRWNWLQKVCRNYKSRRRYTQHVESASASPKWNTVKNTSLHLHAHKTIQIALHMFVCISLSYACLIFRHFRVIIAWTPACITITLVCIQKLHHAFTEKPTNGNTVFPTQNSHKTFHKIHFV